ncbi:MAG: carboxypeptidase-like regulatory domain-containing protein [Breznakibacter sp.]
MKPFSVYLILFLIASTSAKSQTIEIKGKVIDSANSLPIAYASVGVKALGIGTMTNQQGNFSLKLPYAGTNRQVDIRIIGYKTFSFTIGSKNINQTFKLEPLPTELTEVVVQPKDTLLYLLRMAYKAIPKNYPCTPTSYTGFYRETQKTDDTLYLNFTEAILGVYKKRYDNNSNFGQIEILKSRKNNFPGIDTINNVRFYGGPHLVHTRDFVFSKSEFINPRHFNEYSYTLSKQQVIDDRIIYQIDFCHLNNKTHGTLSLDRESLAYVGLELYRLREEPTLLRPYKHLETTEKIGFRQYNNKWHINYIIYNSNGINTKFDKKANQYIEYITTSIQTDSVEPIPFDKEFGYLDIISIKADDYSISDWTDYNILEQDSILSTQASHSHEESMRLLGQTYPVKRNGKDVILSIVNKFILDYGVTYLPATSDGGAYSVYYQDNRNNDLLKIKTLPSYSYSLNFYSKFAYSLNKQWGIFYASSSSLNSNQVCFDHDFGIQYAFPLFKKQRRFLFDSGFAYTYSAYNLNLGNAGKNGNSSISINHKEFDAKKINILWGQRSHGLKPSITINYKIGKITYLFAKASTIFEFASSDRIIFKEKSGFFLSRKTQSISMNNDRLDLLIDNTPVTRSNISIDPYQLSLGLSFRF